MELVSVIIPTFNTPYEYLIQSINSIADQSYRNIEIIIIDDMSTEYNDFEFVKKQIKRCDIFFIKNEFDKGVFGALNTGIVNAKGSIIARMDADDIACRDRIEKQVDFLHKNPFCSVVAGYVKCFGNSKKTYKTPISNTAIKASLLFHDTIVHPSVCFRKKIYDNLGLLYPNSLIEDYEFWTNIACFKDEHFGTINNVVLKYRIHKNQVTKTRKPQMDIQFRALKKHFFEKLDIVLSEKDLEDYCSLCLNNKVVNIQNVTNVLKKIYCSACASDIFDDKKEFTKTFWKFARNKIINQIRLDGKKWIKIFFQVLKLSKKQGI